jgi:hypothetical protein
VREHPQHVNRLLPAFDGVWLGYPIEVVLDLWETLEPTALESLHAAVADLGRFFGRPAQAVY